MATLLALVIGLLVGYYGWTIYRYTKGVYDMLAEKYDAHQAGVVRPNVSRVTRNKTVDLESDTGGVLRPSPNQVLLDRSLEREKRIKQVTP